MARRPEHFFQRPRCHDNQPHRSWPTFTFRPRIEAPSRATDRSAAARSLPACRVCLLSPDDSAHFFFQYISFLIFARVAMRQPDHTGCMTLHSARQKPLGVIMEAAPLQICRLRLRLCVFFSPPVCFFILFFLLFFILLSSPF